MRPILLLIISLISLSATAGTVTGIITDNNGIILPYASISVKGTTKGAVANSAGKYAITLEPGTYTFVCQFVGYQKSEKTLTVTAENSTLNFSLQVQTLTMAEVVIKKGEDPALEIIRQTIRKRDSYNKQVDSFTVDVYVKGLLRSRGMPDRFFGQKIDKKDMEKDGLDSGGKGILFLSESLTKVAYKEPGKIKMEVVSSRQSGGGMGLSFPFFTNFYTNNVSLFISNLNPRGFISPIADNAFHYYSFHYEGNFFEGNRMIDRIKVTPRRKHEPLFNGYLFIVDGEWRIHSLDLTTTSDYQLELIDTLQVRQIHAPVTNDIWRIQNQVTYVSANKFGFDMSGNFLNVYSNYNLEPGFGKKYFDRVVMSYDTAYNKRDSTYWNTIRSVPLEADEKRDFIVKDSLSKYYRDSLYSRRNIDSLRKARKPIAFKNFFIGGVDRNFYSFRSFTSYRLEPLLRELEYNTVEGLAIDVKQSFTVRPRKGNLDYKLNWNTRYGISNEHLNSYMALTLNPKTDNFRNRYFQLAGGKRLSQINKDNPIDALTNSFYTLFYKRNYMKLYENWFGSLEYNNRTESGVTMNFNATWEDRIPLENSTDYSFFYKDRTFLPNHPYELETVPFEKQQALVVSGTVSWQPGQYYMQLPTGKVPLGSDKPVFELQYTKGIDKVLGSDADFDKWKFSVSDRLNLKIDGEFRYRLSVGGFLNDRKVGLPDYQHFNGNQTFYNFKYLNSFQLAPYYRYSNTERFYALGHVEHHFNGLLTNKIPLFNRLKWNLVAGSNTFYVNRDNYYVEAFAGLENIFKIFRVDFVTAYQAQPGNSFGIRIGLGGIIGGAVQFGGR
ncbi:MAG TPA: DUF5686 and carboxypeptidase regulatory-like domain-containing protein [Flavisolibacter sp.]|nr:DUF5686 and carboxypeptidase regulatory-like domain-containing protein [Flavisolibacter sp.]